MKLTIDIPKIPEEQKSELVVLLLEVISQQGEIIQELKDEIARLKGHNPKPKITPSQLEQPQKDERQGRPITSAVPVPRKDKSQPNWSLTKSSRCLPRTFPKGLHLRATRISLFRVLTLKAYNIRYLLECWQTPDGSYVTAEPPAELGGKHFAPDLIRFVLYQYHHCHVTQPLLLEQLHELGVDISAGQISNILIEGKKDFHQEKGSFSKKGDDISNLQVYTDTYIQLCGKDDGHEYSKNL